ncbi:LysR substrate-binding domain-containing protein [Paremcibacter congregatus]|uniref:LysR substrate-binding domain-containing protein n=1 Tax=Paremcibacter congregatus TaxID=2043170 RepID=UPI003A950F74
MSNIGEARKRGLREKGDCPHFPADAKALAFDRADLVLQAAIKGMGIALGRTLLIDGDIAQGFLKPVRPAIPMKSAYWLACSPEFANTERHATLLVWLKREA